MVQDNGLDSKLEGFSEDELSKFREDVRKQLFIAYTNWVGRINSWYLSRLVTKNEMDVIKRDVKKILLKLYYHKNGKLFYDLNNVLQSIVRKTDKIEQMEIPPKITTGTFVILLFMNPSAYIKDIIELAKSLSYSLFSDGKKINFNLVGIENLRTNFWSTFTNPLENSNLIQTSYEKQVKTSKTKIKKESQKRVVLLYKLYKLIKFAYDDLEKLSKSPVETVMLRISHANNNNKILLVKLSSDSPYELAKGKWGFPTIKVDKFSHQLKKENDLKKLCTDVKEKINQRLELVYKFIGTNSKISYNTRCYFPLGTTSVAGMLIEPTDGEQEFIEKFCDKTKSMSNQDPRQDFIAEKYERSDFFDYKEGVKNTIDKSKKEKLYFRTLFYFAYKYADEIRDDDKRIRMLEKVRTYIDNDDLTKGQFDLMTQNNWGFFNQNLKYAFKRVLANHGITINF